ncbi:hypothetical protein [Photobacterium profundum]|uniref:hypothetical protein n=1 Tax=Photobacterium profundum TaxID=74109 RepID=UPI003D0CDC14
MAQQEDLNEKVVEFTSTPTSEVAFFQLSGGSTGTPKLIPRTHNDYYYSVRTSAELPLGLYNIDLLSSGSYLDRRNEENFTFTAMLLLRKIIYELDS